MNLTIDELLDYTDEERAKWEAWFKSQANEPLKLPVPIDVHPTLGALILHCFWAELYYAHWMRGEPLSPAQMKEIIEGLDSGQADQLFEFGHDERKALRDAIGAYTEEDWEKNFEAEGGGFAWGDRLAS